MANWTDFIINKRKTVVAVFFILTIIAAIAQFFVSVNYNMSDYLPDEAPSTQALEVMENEFTASVPNTRVMLEDITVQEALV